MTAGWSVTQQRTLNEVRDSGALSGTVREWTHDESGDTVEVRAVLGQSAWNSVNYHVYVGGECDAGLGTMAEAIDLARYVIDHHPDGLGEEGA